MARMLAALGSVTAVMVIGACGGPGPRRESPASARSVSEQVRQALLGVLESPALPQMATARRPRLPYSAVRACVGPPQGSAGRYRCATTPRGPRGVRSVAVQVRSDGEWSTQPLPVETTVSGHSATAVTSVWGTGIQLPG
jgi:hypothetical protein